MELSQALAILSAMITPAVLISACGSLTISTSARLGRVTDRTRSLLAQFEALAQMGATDAFTEQRRALIYDQLQKAAQRSRVLQRALTSLYIALGIFVATSAALGVVIASGERLTWFPPLLGIIGTSVLLYTSILLIIEARLTRIALSRELDFVMQIGSHYFPETLSER